MMTESRSRGNAAGAAGVGLLRGLVSSTNRGGRVRFFRRLERLIHSVYRGQFDFWGTSI
jgi:hypothetical protein